METENRVIGQVVVEILLIAFEMGEVTTLARLNSPIRKVFNTKCSAKLYPLRRNNTHDQKAIIGIMQNIMIAG